MTLLLKNAHIVDGSGGEPFRGDILINGDLISAVGSFRHKKTDEIIDCQGAYVVPGFIDAHSTTDHYGSLLKYPEQEHYLEQGITSAIGGYDGISLAPFVRNSNQHFGTFHTGRGMNVDWTSFGEFLAVLQRIKPGMNFGSFVGYDHGIQHIEHSLREGAFGVSLGKLPLSRTAEKTLDAVLLHYKTVLSVPYLARSAQELKHFTKLVEGGVKILFHNVFSPFATEEEHKRVFEILADYSKRGFAVAVPSSEFLTVTIGTLLPEWLKALSRVPVLEKLSDEWLRKKIMVDIPDVSPEHLLIVHAPHHTTLVGLTLKQIMHHYGIRDAKEALLKLMRITELRAAVRLIHKGTDYHARILELPSTLIGSFEPGAYRTDWHSFEANHGFLSLLWNAEQRGIDGVRQIVEQLTKRPALFFGITKRGTIKEGMRADLVVFKNKTLKFTVVNGGMTRSGEALHHEIF